MNRILSLVSALIFLVISNLCAQNNIPRKGTMKVRRTATHSVKDEVKNPAEVLRAKADVAKAQKDAESRLKAQQDSIRKREEEKTKMALEKFKKEHKLK